LDARKGIWLVNTSDSKPLGMAVNAKYVGYSPLYTANNSTCLLQKERIESQPCSMKKLGIRMTGHDKGATD